MEEGACVLRLLCYSTSAACHQQAPCLLHMVGEVPYEEQAEQHPPVPLCSLGMRWGLQSAWAALCGTRCGLP